MSTPKISPTRVLTLEIDGSAVSATSSELDPGSLAGSPLAAAAGLGGVGVALALVGLHAPRVGDPSPLAIGVGPAVIAGVPTAMRASLFGRAALFPQGGSGRVAQGQVGGSLASRIARFADAVVITGGGALRGSVLVLGEDGSAHIEQLELPSSLPERTAFLGERFGTDAVLAVGLAAERGVRLASLAVGGRNTPSYVGRGGLGLCLAQTGVSALVVCGAALDVQSDEKLRELLLRSPRLATRGASGSLELWHQAGASGELHDANDRPLAPGAGHATSSAAENMQAERHGCRGCPTPCGWTFETPDGQKRGARFAATRALGPELGLERLEDSLVLLSAANVIGVDAKELGMSLRTAFSAGELVQARGDIEALVKLVYNVGTGTSLLAQGSVRLAEQLQQPLRSLHGQAVLSVADPARLLGQCVGGGGVDPMRTFTVLADTPELERWSGWLAPVTLSAPALDPSSTIGKGRLVAFQEELLGAVDLAGFCAFTAGALLSDGLLDVDGLARALGAADAQELRTAGATFVLVRRWLDEQWGSDPRDECPDWARARLTEPGMLAEYRACRGLTEAGRTDTALLARLGERSLLVPRRPLPVASARPNAPAAAPMEPATVRLVAVGPLAVALDTDLGAKKGAFPLTVEAPATVERLLAALVRLPRTGQFLGAALPGVWRGGRLLSPDQPLSDGDRLDLVLAISGG